MSRRILHLVGSAVDERMAALSRLYARDCLATVAAGPAAGVDGGEQLIAHVSPDRRWRFVDDLAEATFAATRRRSR